VLLTWQDNSDDEDGFIIVRDGSTIAIVPSNQTSYLDEGLSPSTTYVYQVKAYNSAGESGYSNQAQATTFDLTASCQGYCGGQGAGGCWCDQSCWDYGDCCPDVCEVCGICSPNCVDADGDGYFPHPRCGGEVDCDDLDSTVYPGAPEICDGIDSNCDGLNDEVDADFDGYMICEGDCDDDNPSTFPGAPEICDGADNNCDGIIPSNEADYDRDNYMICQGDCNDLDPDIHPGALESCDGIDSNCDGLGDEVDSDQDGYMVCEGDCDDNNQYVYPNAPDRYDGIDNQCPGDPGYGLIDEGCYINSNVWARTYGGSEDDVAYSVFPTSDNGYIVAGYTESFSKTIRDFWILKLNEKGEIIWDKKYDTWDDVAYSIQETSDGGFIVAGETHRANYRGWVLKLNSNGDKVWDRILAKSTQDSIIYAVKETPEKNYVVAGGAQTRSDGYCYEFWVIKLDSNGNLIWDKTYHRRNYIEFDDIAYDIDVAVDGYIVGGYNAYHGSNSWIIKIDKNGNFKWDFVISDSVCNSVLTTLNSNFVLTGEGSFNSEDLYVNKIDSLGHSLWHRWFGGNYYESGEEVKFSSDNKYIVVGTKQTTSSLGTGFTDYWILKIDDSGNKIWSRTYGGGYIEEAFSVAATPDGGYIMVGFTESYGNGGKDIWVLKLDANGDCPSCF